MRLKTPREAEIYDEGVNDERVRIVNLIGLWKNWTAEFPEDTGVLQSVLRSVANGESFDEACARLKDGR